MPLNNIIQYICLSIKLRMPKRLPFQAETDVEHDEASIDSEELMFRQSQILDHASAFKIIAGGSTDDDYEHPALPLTSPRGMWNPSAIFPTFRDSFLRTKGKNGFPTKQMSSCHTCEVDRFNPGSLSKAIGKSCACVCVPWSNHMGSLASGHPSYHGNPYSGCPCQSIAKRINHALTMAAVITVRAFLPGFPNFYSMREYRPEVPVREMSSAGHP